MISQILREKNPKANNFLLHTYLVTPSKGQGHWKWHKKSWKSMVPTSITGMKTLTVKYAYMSTIKLFYHESWPATWPNRTINIDPYVIRMDQNMLY